jgi:hypothetical protein
MYLSQARLVVVVGLVVVEVEGEAVIGEAEVAIGEEEVVDGVAVEEVCFLLLLLLLRY